MVQYIQQTNGTMTLDDLGGYHVISRPVKSVRYRGIDLYTIGSPAGGAVCLNILKTMEQFSLADGADANLTAHRLAEAMRFGFGSRVKLGDPGFVDGIHDLEGRMLSDENARRTRCRISDKHTQPVRAYDPSSLYSSEGHGTSHISTADSSGMATSLTTTVNLLFGARIMDPTTGVVL